MEFVSENMTMEIWIATIVASVVGVISLSLFGWLQFRYHWHPRVFKALESIPGPKCIPILGNIQVYWGTSAEIWNTLRSLAKQFPVRYKIWSFNRVAVNIYNPDDIETLMGNPRQISKSEVYNLAQSWLGTGLLTSGGAKWKSRRKLLTPAFHFSILKEFVKIFESNGNRAVDLLDVECTKDHTNVLTFVTEYALHSICETTMGLSIDPKSGTIKNYKIALSRMGEILVHRLFRPWLYSDLIFGLVPIGREMKKVVTFLQKFTSDVIKERLETWNGDAMTKLQSASGKQRLAMLNLLIAGMRERRDINLEGLQEEVDTFMFEGHDTTSMAICFFLLLLAHHREIQDRIVEELHTILGDTNRDATYEDLQAMTYLEMCAKESLRYFPSVPFISRELDEDMVLKDNVVLPKGIYVHIHIYDCHHDPNYWPDPEKYDPERFLPENCVGRHPYSYIPFSAGSRNCIGQRFAMLEIKSFISKILLKYRLEPIDTVSSVIKCADIVLRPQDKIRVRFRKRV